jgi:hypothetical protein
MAETKPFDRATLEQALRELGRRAYAALSAAETDPTVKRFIGTYPSEDEPGLRVCVPKPEYLLAMKCWAMRVGGVETSQDIDDIRRLARASELQTRKKPSTLSRPFTRAI